MSLSLIYRIFGFFYSLIFMRSIIFKAIFQFFSFQARYIFPNPPCPNYFSTLQPLIVIFRGICSLSQRYSLYQNCKDLVLPFIVYQVQIYIIVILLNQNQTINKNRERLRMAHDINNKQSYLYQEIIKGGYDPEKFLQFITSANPKAKDNLQLWDIQALQQSVSAFKNTHLKINTQLQELNKQTINVKQQVQVKSQEQLNKSQNQIKGRQNDRNSGKYCQILKCNKKVIDENIFKSNVQAVMTSYQKMEGGFFEKCYVVYQILVQPSKIKIKRRYSDFQWLRQKLQYLYPGLPIPPVSKKGTFRRFDDKYVKKRMLILQKFLDKMLNIPQLRTQKIFNQFLTIADKNQFQKFKNSYKNLQKPIEANQMTTLQGSLKLQIDKQSTTFLMQTQKYFSEIQPNIKKIYKEFKGCATALQTCSDTYKSIAATCNHLWTIDSDFRVSNQLPILQNNVFSNFQLISNQSSQLLLQQASLIRNQLHSMFKYQSLCIMNLQESLRILGQKQMEFYDTRTALLKKKIRLYEEGIISKWGCEVKLTQKPHSKEQAFGLMLVRETNQAKKMRQNYAVFNVQLQAQCQRYFKQNNKFLGLYSRVYVQSLSRLNSESMMMWVDTLSSVMDTQQVRKIIINQM